MKLISKVEIPEIQNKLRYSDKILFLGSCFSGNIGGKFKDGLFDVMINPFGVIFNPISIFKLIERSLDSNFYSEKDWVLFNDRYINFELHGDFSFENLQDALEFSNSTISRVGEYLKKSNYLFITLGTAWVYDYLKNMQVVANCHKVPQKEFNKRLLEVDEIYDASVEVLKRLKSINSNLNIVFTVSPVRHLADGAHSNNISKSTLHLFVHKYQNKYSSQYFPSYEIVMDELRDYRFFSRDLMHPNELATDYVWEILFENWISNESQVLYSKIEKLKKSSTHRPFNLESEAHQKFLSKSIQKLRDLKMKNSNIDFDELEEVFKSQLILKK